MITTNVLTKMIDEFAIFDEKINIKCNDESINFKAVGIEGNMNVEIPIDDVDLAGSPPGCYSTAHVLSGSVGKRFPIQGRGEVEGRRRFILFQINQCILRPTHTWKRRKQIRKI